MVVMVSCEINSLLKVNMTLWCHNVSTKYMTLQWRRKLAFCKGVLSKTNRSQWSFP